MKITSCHLRTKRAYFIEDNSEKLQWKIIRDIKQLTSRMNPVKRMRFAEGATSAEDTIMEPRWDNLPYMVIHNIAKLDLQLFRQDIFYI